MHTKTDVAVREIRRRVLTGVYESGMRLVQSELVDELGLGVTPVREALMQLVSEGLLIRKPYAGVVVAGISQMSLEVYAIRKVLEKYATEQACAHIIESELHMLHDLIEDMNMAHQESDDTRYQNSNQLFHMTIYDASRNGRLKELIEAQWRAFPRGVFGLDATRRESSLEEHRHILHAIERKDHLTAGALMVAHIGNSEERLHVMLKK